MFQWDGLVISSDFVVILDCEGIDTVSNMFINGQLVGSTDNMFRRYRFDIGSNLKPGENELRGNRSLVRYLKLHSS